MLIYQDPYKWYSKNNFNANIYIFGKLCTENCHLVSYFSSRGKLKIL